KVDYVGHERNAAAVAVREQPEKECAGGAHGQRRGSGPNDFFFGYAKLMRQRVKEKNDDKEIECVERPAEESREDRMMRPGTLRLNDISHFSWLASRPAWASGARAPARWRWREQQEAALPGRGRNRVCQC